MSSTSPCRETSRFRSSGTFRLWDTQSDIVSPPCQGINRLQLAGSLIMYPFLRSRTRRVHPIDPVSRRLDRQRQRPPSSHGSHADGHDGLPVPTERKPGGEAIGGAATSNLASVSDLSRLDSWPQHSCISAEHPYVRISSVCRCPPLVTRTTRTDVDISPSDSYPQARSSWST